MSKILMYYIFTPTATVNKTQDEFCEYFAALRPTDKPNKKPEGCVAISVSEFIDKCANRKREIINEAFRLQKKIEKKTIIL